MAEQYLFPRVCPILALSWEDLVRCIEKHGRSKTFETLAQLITKYYDFPYVRSCNPRTPAPSALEPPNPRGQPRPAPPTMLLGGYRCTRLSSATRIPGITLIMKDTLSRLDWALDTFLEEYRMKCWVAVQGKTRRWNEDAGRNDLRSPYAKATHTETLCKLLDAEMQQEGLTLNHGTLRDIVIAHGEVIPPTVELYLQTIDKLNPTSISARVVNYGVSVAALACVATPELSCSYRISRLSDNVVELLHDFVKTTGKEEYLIEKPETSSSMADLVFIDALPYGSYDMRAYLGEETTPRHVTYPQHLHDILANLTVLVEKITPGPPVRIALVVSLREMPTMPTIEPILLTIMSDATYSTRIQLVGALISQKRDYAIYLMLLHSTERPRASDADQWGKLLTDHYPELKDASLQKAQPVAGPAATWDATCLQAARHQLVIQEPDVSGIALQGPRKLRGKACFPTRTRICHIVSETTNLETGDVAYVFGEAIEPPPVTVVIVPPPKDETLVSRMVSAIRESIADDVTSPP